jgi:hypothetical protein
MKMAVFWAVTPYKTTRHYNPEDSHLPDGKKIIHNSN